MIFKSCSGCIVFVNGAAFEAHSLITQSCLISNDLYACVSYTFLLVLIHYMSNPASYHVLSKWEDAWDAYASQTQSSLISSDVGAFVKALQANRFSSVLTCSYLNCSIIALCGVFFQFAR